MNPYLQEVLDAHVLIEHWLSHGEGSAEALMKRFAADFTMIPLSGEKMTTQR
ncbi:putative cytoplasmic protein [Klebsiella pneumoniae subsp. rhinoscleromatis]|nr:putative cytoplasmic protein [Klebsiella pneumoniae subsp. rhinoscleromatis]